MENKDKIKKAISLALRLAALGGCTALCVPVHSYFNELIGGGETTLESFTGAAVLCCIIMLIVLAVITGLRALAGRPYKLTVFALAAYLILCVAMVWMCTSYEPSVISPAFENGSDAEAGSGAAPGTEFTATPRPTVTPPPVEIEVTNRYNTNPESGTVFYRRYFDNTVSLTIDNTSSRDLAIKLRTQKKSDLVLSFYVRANEAVTVSAPVGTYEMVYAIGRNWIDEDELFGENTKYKKAKELFTFAWNGEYEITVSKGYTELLEVSRSEFDKD